MNTRTPEYLAALLVPYGCTFRHFRKECSYWGYSSVQSHERIRLAYRGVREQLGIKP